MNIVVIVVDTLRYDYVGAHGNPWIKTPNMDALAARSWVFDRSFTGSYPTIPHRTDALTGRYGGPFHAWKPLAFDVLTLPRTLAAAGYCTQLLHDTPHLVNGGHNFDWPFHAWTQIRGAEVDRPWIGGELKYLSNWAPDPLFDCVDETHPAGKDAVWTNTMMLTYSWANRHRQQPEDWTTARLFQTACDFLRENRRRNRFFLWVDCFDPHEPWDVPPEMLRMYDPTPGFDGRIDPRSFLARQTSQMPAAAAKRVAAAYAAKVSWVDKWLGEFLRTFDETGLARNTAILFTTDHGTNVAERGSFGKGYPVREQEARQPLMIYVPEGGTGRSDLLVQPQDIYATLLGIAGMDSSGADAAALKLPAGVESHDVLRLAGAGRTGPRRLALSNNSLDGWKTRPEGHTLFTASDRDWCLEVAGRLEDCKLYRLGSVEDVAAQNPKVVQELHAAALEELERRGSDPALMRWARAGARGPVPADCRFYDGWPGCEGYCSYFQRIYAEKESRVISNARQ